MNKKIIVGSFGLVLFMCVVSAGLLSYFGEVSQDIVIDQAIMVSGLSVDTLNCEASGEHAPACGGSFFSIVNTGENYIRYVVLSNDAPTNEIEVTYEIEGYGYANPGENITLVPGTRYIIKPRYVINPLIESGTYTVTTTVLPA